MNNLINLNSSKLFKNEDITIPELVCPKCQNNMLAFFHETFILNIALKKAKDEKYTKKYKYINGEIFSFENDFWKKEEYNYAPIFVCKCGFYDLPLNFVKIDNNENKPKSENIEELKKIIEEKDNEIKKLKNELKENNKNKELIKDLKNQINKKDIKIKELNNEISKNKKNMINLEKNIEKMKEEINKLKQENDKLKNNKK